MSSNDWANNCMDDMLEEVFVLMTRSIPYGQVVIDSNGLGFYRWYPTELSPVGLYPCGSGSPEEVESVLDELMTGLCLLPDDSLVDVDACLVEGTSYDQVAAKWMDLMKQYEDLDHVNNLTQMLETGRQVIQSDDPASRIGKSEVIGNVIYPEIFIRSE